MYTAATGAVVAEHTVDVIANNLANTNTAGFKRALLQVQSQQANDLYRWQSDPGSRSSSQLDGVATRALIGTLGNGAEIYDTPTNFEQGSLQSTGNELDFGLYGPGFFAVRDGNGAVRYTRDGSFVRTANNQLATVAGDVVLDDQLRPIVLPNNGAKVMSDQTGRLNVNGVTFAKLGIFDFQNQVLVRSADSNRFNNNSAGATPDTNTTVVQAVIEKSNADVVRSMVDLINAERWFEANEKVIQTEDDATGVAITQVGRTATNG
jgi:flagellar basal-body rod protein FlgG